MGKYTCRLVTSWILFSLALIGLVIAMILEGWGLYTNYTTNIRQEFGLFIRTYYQYSSYNNYFIEYYSLGKDFRTAIFALLGVSSFGCGVCVLLSFIMMCADCCCRVTQCMAVIPKITMAFALIAGILAECACVIFLVDVYAVDQPSHMYDVTLLPTTGYVIPYYCFYIVVVMGILLMVAGCTNFGARHASKVGVTDQMVTSVTVVGGQNQTSGVLNPYLNQNNMQMGYFAQHGYQATPMGYMPPNMGYIGPRLVVTHTSTQTSNVDIGKTVKYEGGKYPYKK